MKIFNLTLILARHSGFLSMKNIFVNTHCSHLFIPPFFVFLYNQNKKSSFLYLATGNVVQPDLQFTDYLALQTIKVIL